MLYRPLRPKIFRVMLAFRDFALHPIFIFVVLQVVSVTLTVIWVMWYVKRSRISFFNNYDLAFLITGCILTGTILIGTVLLFVFAIKQSSLNKQQRNFVSSVTHELRSPIASMQLALETLQNRTLSADLHATVMSMMLADLNRLVKLVDQILVSARLDRGIALFRHLESISLRDTLEDVVKSANHINRNLDSRVEVRCLSSLKMVTAKPALELVIGNLLENAIKYSPRNTPIVIDADASAKKNGRVIISVRDQGLGLSRAEQRRIFRMFNRGEVATKKAIPGTGLGLYIVRSVAKILGGKVWVESEGSGMGSTFFVDLPIDQVSSWSKNT